MGRVRGFQQVRQKPKGVENGQRVGAQINRQGGGDRKSREPLGTLGGNVGSAHSQLVFEGC